jgi:hypothetical protein
MYNFFVFGYFEGQLTMLSLLGLDIRLSTFLKKMLENRKGQINISVVLVVFLSESEISVSCLNQNLQNYRIYRIKSKSKAFLPGFYINKD